MYQTPPHIHARTRTRKRVRTHTHTHAHARTHTHKYDHKIWGFTSILEGGQKHYSIYNQG